MYPAHRSQGGKGGYSTGNVYLTAGTVLYIHVGGQGGTFSNGIASSTANIHGRI